MFMLALQIQDKWCTEYTKYLNVTGDAKQLKARGGARGIGSFIALKYLIIAAGG